MKLHLRYYRDKILRKKCKKVTHITEDIKKLALDMIETMDKSNGIGLSANQVGSGIMMFVMRSYDRDQNNEPVLGASKVFINPIISNFSEKKVPMVEGCLSFPGIHLEVYRPYSIHLEAKDLNWKDVSCDLEKIEARVVMHETDHLNGKTFLERASFEELEKVKDVLEKIGADFL